MKKYFLYISLTLFFLVSGCKKDFIINEEQKILYQMEYVNYAWGYQHNGFIIDTEGHVLTYSNPDTWNFPDSNFTITSEKLAENLSLCRQSGIIIPAEELKKYAGYIGNIASSKLTALRNVGADAGSTEFVCYQFSPESHSYKGYLIKLEGDYTRENLNFYSKKVIVWMKEIQSNISLN